MVLEYTKNKVVSGEVIPVRVPKPIPGIQVQSSLRAIPEIAALRYVALTKKQINSYNVI